MSATDELVAWNERYAEGAGDAPNSPRPRKRIAVVTCMDARIEPGRALGLQNGDAHVIRNAGGVATEDVIRSLLLSQRLLGTREIVVVQHTDCGGQMFEEADLKDAIEGETGVRPPFALGAFSDLDESVRQSMGRLASSPLLPHRDRIRGFVYDVDSGRLREVGSR